MRFLLSVFATIFVAIAPAAAADVSAIHVKVSGKEGAPAILFVPGLASDGAVWDGIIPAFENTNEVHVATLAGFAGKPPVEGPFVETRLNAIRDYLDEHELEDVTLVGHSLGGFMAMRLAIDAPEHTGKIVIVDSVPFLAQFFLGAMNAEQAIPRASAIRDQLGQLTDEQFKVQQMQVAASQSDNPEKQELILKWSLASDRETVANAMYELLATDLRPQLSEITVPMLVLYPWREGGPFAAAQTDAAYAAQYDNAQTASLKRIDDAVHFMMYSKPDEVIAEITSFIGASH